MSDGLSLAPGFSPVFVVVATGNRFNGFPCDGKPLKRLTAFRREHTRLKPGVNEKGHSRRALLRTSKTPTKGSA